jgi:hypothetical protein
MYTWRSRFCAMACAILLGGAGAAAAAADPGMAAEGHHRVAVITLVRARDLMSSAERQSYRRALRQARTAEERQRIRETALETLRQRAAEHGLVMVIETRVPRLGEAGKTAATRLEVPEHPAPLPPRAP